LIFIFLTLFSRYLTQYECEYEYICYPINEEEIQISYPLTIKDGDEYEFLLWGSYRYG